MLQSRLLYILLSDVNRKSNGNFYRLKDRDGHTKSGSIAHNELLKSIADKFASGKLSGSGGGRHDSAKLSIP